MYILLSSSLISHLQTDFNKFFSYASHQSKECNIHFHQQSMIIKESKNQNVTSARAFNTKNELKIDSFILVNFGMN